MTDTQVRDAQVLIVDDDPALLEALPEALRLRMSELQVDTADSGRAALDRMQEGEYDALVVDIKMPGMDGLELLREIKQMSPDTPTILITGHGDHDLAVQALRFGAQDYVTKPIDRDYFVTSLRRAIECHRLSREVATKRMELLKHTEELEACVQERTLELREALHREQIARRELAAVNQQLDAMHRERDQFVSIIAHDLATPLTTIRGYAELLGQPNVERERHERARTVIISETGRLARLAGSLADTSRGMGEPFQMELRRCDMVEVAREQVELARLRSTHHAIRLDAPQSARLICDRDRISQVLANLLANAVKYTSDGEITVRVNLDNERIILSVSDEGPGIPNDQAELIFEPGSRLTTAGAGTSAESRGFGLYIAREIIEAHGGRIWVAPAERRGVTFHIVLPVSPEMPVQGMQQRDHATTGLSESPVSDRSAGQSSSEGTEGDSAVATS